MADNQSIIYQLKRLGITCSRTLGWCSHSIRGSWRSPAFEVIKASGAHAFMGYYDVVLMRGRKLYFHRVAKSDGRKVHPNSATIVCLDRDTGKQTDICTTRAVNWQIGARAQLIKEDSLVLNDLDYNGKLCAKKVDLTSGRESWLDFPFWYIGSESGLAASVDFQALALQRPGYGYPGEIAAEAANSLVIFAPETGDVLLRYTRDEIADALDMPRAGYLNHVIASPSEHWFLTTLNITTGAVRMVHPVMIELKTGIISSFNAGHTFSHPQFIDETRLLYFDGTAFCVYDMANNIKQTLFTTRNDGHPTQIAPDIFLADTYPNRFSEMEVYLHGQVHQTLARVYNPPWYAGDIRCDLHPRYVDRTVLFDFPTVAGRMIGLIDLAVS